MRQRPKTRDKKLTSIVKSRVSGVYSHNPSIATRKRATIPWSRRARFQTRIKGHLMQSEKQNKRSAGRVSVARKMAQLHLPFVDWSKRQPQSDAEILKKLRWSTVDAPRDHQASWEGERDLCHEALPAFCSDNGPHWSVPPRKSPYRAIVKYILHLFWVWKRSPSLQIPRGWPVFSSVNWEQVPLELATSDSSDSRAQVNRNDLLGVRPGDPTDHEVWRRTFIHCQPRSIQQPRTRIQWELLGSMLPSGFEWRPQTTARARQRDARRHTGFLDCNQSSHDKDIWPQTALSAFLYPLNSDTEYYVERVRPTILSELYESSEVGRLVMNVVATDAFPSQWRKPLKWPLFLTRGVSPPIIEYTCQAECTSSSWGKSFRPLLFAAQDREELSHNPIEKLALAFQPMMTLFTLYYLDTRTNREEPMPDWMVLFGTVYDEYGIELLAFFPSFRLPESELPDAGDWGWGTSTYSISRDHRYVMGNPPWERAAPLAMLHRIQGHCEHVLERLKCWDGYHRISARLGGQVVVA